MLPTAASIVDKLPRFLRRHRLMTAWMKLTGEDPIQLVRIRDNAYGFADMSDGFLRLIVIDKNYDIDFFRIADSLLIDGGTFLDVGANYGLLSFGLAARHGAGGIDFHLFEPNPKLVPIIRRTQSLYPSMRFTLNAKAVSSQAGKVSFAINEAQSGASHIAVLDENGVDVPVTTLDSYIAEHQLKNVDLLKLDVEGFELPALKGATESLTNRVIKAVYFEYFEKYLVRVSAPSDLIAFLSNLGFITCFARSYDLEPRGGPTHTFKVGDTGHSVKLLPVAGHQMPPMTDLLAIPQEHIQHLS